MMVSASAFYSSEVKAAYRLECLLVITGRGAERALGTDAGGQGTGGDRSEEE